MTIQKSFFIHIFCAGVAACSLYSSILARDNMFFTISGPNVTECSYLPNNAMATITSDSRFGLYETWSSAWHFTGKYGTISFDAATTNDIHVGISNVNPANVVLGKDNLYSQMTGYNNLYEIVIGGWGNEHSAIREGSQTYPSVFVGGGIPRDQSNNTITSSISYKVIFYHNEERNKDTVAVFVQDPNTQNWHKLMFYNTKFFEGPRWFSFSSWNADITYTNISASESTDLPV